MSGRQRLLENVNKTFLQNVEFARFAATGFQSSESCKFSFTFLIEPISHAFEFQNVADEIRHLLDANDRQTPAVVEIPSKDKPYDPTNDSILQRAQKMFSADELR